jgi:4-hydroxybenzoate polyprenyltransferase
MSSSSIKNYLSLIKFSHTIFALPFAIVGFCLALKTNATGVLQNSVSAFGTALKPSKLLILFLLVVGCMVFARSAAMAFNRWLDAAIDKKNPRTAIREIPSGVVPEKNALLFVLLCCVLFLVCTWFINPLCFYLAPVALAVVLGYSYTKRFTAFCHFVLGIGLGLAPIGAYIAVTGKFALLPLLFSFAVLFWVAGFDIIYALQDEEFDRSQQLNSVPAKFGKQKALFISRLCHVTAAVFIVAAIQLGQFNYLGYVAALVFIGLLVYQQRLVTPTNLSKVNLAFFTTNGIASVVFALLLLISLFTTNFNG